MDKNTISRIITNTLVSIPYKNIDIIFEDNDVISIEMISDSFAGERVLKRISLLSDLCRSISMNELQDYNLVFIPLTENEKKLSISETGTTSDNKSEQGKMSAKSSEALY